MKPLADQNLYELLEVPPDAREDDIVKAWDRLSALCAPGALATYTLVGQDDAALLGRRLEEALSVLLDPLARQRYDASLSLTPAPRAGSCAEASASGPAEPARPRALAPLARSRPMPPIIPPLRKVPASSAPAAESPIPLERLAPPPAEAAPVAEVAPAPLPPAAALPCSPPFAAVTPAPATLPAVAAPAPAALPVAESVPAPAAAGAETSGAPLPGAARYTGDVLRRAREARGITLPQLCERTKITRHHVENLEADRYERLPAPVYLRGMLMAMSKELRLDGQKVARSYLEAMAEAVPPAPPLPPRATQR